MSHKKLRAAFFCAIAFGSTYSQGAYGLDVAQAVKLEGIFRAIAVQCGDPAFAKIFISESRSQVRVSLQGGQVTASPEQIETQIHATMRHPELQQVIADKCPVLLPQLRELHQTRINAMKATDEVKKGMGTP